MTSKTASPLGEFDTPFAVLKDDEVNLGDVIAENLPGDGLQARDLPRVTFPREATTFEVPDVFAPNGLRSMVEIVAVPLRQLVTRSMYIESYEPGRTDPPDCASPDGLTGFPNEGKSIVAMSAGFEVQFGGACVKCPLNQWGSDFKGGRGKQCREHRNILLMEPGSSWPIVLRLPPTQLGPWRDFCASLSSRRLVISQVVVGFSIAKSRDTGLTMLVCDLKGVLPAETRAALLPIAQSTPLLQAPQNYEAQTRGGFLDDEAPPLDDDIEPPAEPY